MIAGISPRAARCLTEPGIREDKSSWTVRDFRPVRPYVPIHAVNIAINDIVHTIYENPNGVHLPRGRGVVEDITHPETLYGNSCAHCALSSRRQVFVITNVLFTIVFSVRMLQFEWGQGEKRSLFCVTICEMLERGWGGDE